MMHTWFECKVRYDKTLETGMQKKVNEPYLVDALSFTEAEARIIKEITPFISGEFEVANIKKARINEMFFDESGDKWYKCKVNFITLDEKSGTEKKTASSIMVQAADLKQALDTLVTGMSGTLADYEVAAITETAIMDVYPYTADDDNSNANTNANQNAGADANTPNP
jgi:chlorite dismutase